MADLIAIVAREMTLRNYSRKTIAAYSRIFSDLYKMTRRPLRDLKEDEIKEYLHAKQQTGWSSQSVALAANAINFLYTQIYKRRISKITISKKDPYTSGGFDERRDRADYHADADRMCNRVR